MFREMEITLIVSLIIHTLLPIMAQFAKGILFNWETEVVQAEKWKNIEFLIPFPTIDLTPEPELNRTIKSLTKFKCEWDLSQFKGDPTNWFVKKINEEKKEIQKELNQVKAAAPVLIPQRYNEEDPEESFQEPEIQRDKSKRAIFTMAAAAAAVAGLGLGYGIGNPIECWIKSCDENKALKKDIVKTINTVNRNSDNLKILSNKMDEKFVMVASQLKQLWQEQKDTEMNLESQSEILSKLNASFIYLSLKQHEMECKLEYFEFYKINYVARLNALWTGIKLFRTGLRSYTAMLLEVIPSLTEGYLPPSLLAPKDLKRFIQKLAAEEMNSESRLSPTLSLTKILAYYQNKLVNWVFVTEFGLHIRMGVPFNSMSRQFRVYQAFALPMYKPPGDTFTKWILDTPYFAVSRDNNEFAQLSKNTLKFCKGGSMRICERAFPTYRNREVSCLASLFFNSNDKVVQLCSTEAVPLPLTETAVNLGFGCWLFTSPKSSVSLANGSVEKGYAPNQVPACRACILMIDCNHFLEGLSVILCLDRMTCAKYGYRRMDVELPKPLEGIYDALPAIPEDVYLTNPTLQQNMIQEVREQLKKNPRLNPVTRKQWKELAEPIGKKLTLSKMLSPEVLKEYTPWKVSVLFPIISLTLGLISAGVVGWMTRK